MAIKGYLSEITFVELVKIVGKQDGKLGIWNFNEKKQYECFFRDQKVAYLNFCGTPVTSRDWAKQVFIELVKDNKSYYAFQYDRFPVITETSLFSLNELLDYSLSESKQTPAVEEFLPHIDTRFETVNKVDFVLQGELAEFWRDCMTMLHKGCSGGEICMALGLPEKEVLQNLYKLRTTGLIKPVRMFSISNPALKNKLMGQNLSKIANRMGGSQPKPASVSQPSVAPLPTSENIPVPNFLNQPTPQEPPTPTNLSQEKENQPASETLSQRIARLKETLDLRHAEQNMTVTEEPFTQAPTSISSSNIGFHNSVNDSSALPKYTVNISSSNTSQPVAQPDMNTVAPARTERAGLLKRMLGSLFRR